MKLRSLSLHTVFNFHITDELNAQLDLSEHLLSDIADSIGRKSPIVSKLAMLVHVYTSLCYLKVSSLTDSTETLLSTSEQQHQELQVYVYLAI